MLVLSRKPNESIFIGDHVTVTVISVRGNNVRLGIKAPRDVEIHRDEIRRKIEAQHRGQDDDTEADETPACESVVEIEAGAEPAAC